MNQSRHECLYRVEAPPIPWRTANPLCCFGEASTGSDKRVAIVEDQHDVLGKDEGFVTDAVASYPETLDAGAGSRSIAFF